MTGGKSSGMMICAVVCGMVSSLRGLFTSIASWETASDAQNAV
jgi:ABC-type Mn2+/Zn2+ transport system permease subunit